MKKKVLIVYSSDISESSNGGIKSYMFELIENRTDLDIDLLVVCNGNVKKDLNINKFFPFKITKKPIIVFFLLGVLRAYFTKKIHFSEYDTVIFNRHEEALLSFMFRKSNKILFVHGSVKYWFKYTSFIIAFMNSLLEKIIINNCINSVYVLLQNKEYGVPYYKARYKKMEDKIFYAPVPISPVFTEFNNLGNAITDNPFKLVYFGRINNVPKNIFLLPNIVKALLGRKIDVNMTVVGNGPDLQELKNMAHNLGLFDKFVFYGNLNNSLLPEIISKCHLSFILSSYEGICISALESLALGVPVAAYPVGDIPEYLIDMKNGVILDSGMTIEANVDKILRFRNTYNYKNSFRKYIEPYLSQNCFLNIKI